jgi:putative transposase
LQAEIIALRHQLTVLQRTPYPKRVLLNRTDRWFWVWLSRLWSGWRSALIIVKPATVICWHRRGFQWYWTWKVRHGRPGRPKVSKETRELIRTMSCENVTWGAPRIRSELLKLGIKFRGFRGEIYGPPSEASITDLEDLSSQPRVSTRFDRLLHSAYDLV